MPIGFASEAWPRPGLAEPRSASLAGFGFFHQHIRKGKVVITKTSKEKRLLLGSFLAPETDMIFGDGVGASPVVTTADTGGVRDINVYGFSAGSYTGLAVHEILSEFAAFPGLTKVAAIATPPAEMWTKTTVVSSPYGPT